MLFSPKLTEGEARSYAEGFLADGMHFDALNFFARFKDATGLKRLIDIAHDNGDAFLLLRSYKALGVAAPPDELRRLGDRAFELQKYRDALTAYEHLGDKALIERVQPLVVGDVSLRLPVGAGTEV